MTNPDEKKSIAEMTAQECAEIFGVSLHDHARFAKYSLNKIREATHNFVHGGGANNYAAMESFAVFSMLYSWATEHGETMAADDSISDVVVDDTISVALDSIAADTAAPGVHL
jgi:hypothetical protein